MKQHLIKIIAIGFVFLLGMDNGLSAQKKQQLPGQKQYSSRRQQHELLLYGGGGLTSLKYNVNIGKQINGFSGHAGFGYGFFFSREWGLRTGIEFSLYRASFTLDNTSLNYMAIDIENSPFEFRCKMDNYKEKQYLIMLQIPIMLQFQKGTRHQFYAAAGGKLGIPLSVKYNSSKTTIYNSGYYDWEDYEYTTQQFMGFGKFSGREDKLNFKTIAILVSAETGVKWTMGEGYKLYTGIYVDYGLNNMVNQPATPLPFLDYNAAHPADFTVNSIVESQYAQNDEFKTFTNKIVPLAVGVKLTLGF